VSFKRVKRTLAKKFPPSVSETPQFNALIVEIVDLLQAFAKAARGFDGSRDSAVVLVDAGTARYQEEKLSNPRKIQSVDLTDNFAEVRDCRVQNLAGIRNLIAFGALPARPRNRIEV
jgi:hypothetical protein